MNHSRFRVYLETTIPSYLVTRPSRDLVVAGHQQVTSEWWETAKERFELFVSEAVLQEIILGEPEMAARRREIVEELPILELNEDVRHLVRAYEKELGMTGQAKADVIHIAFAVAYEMDYLVTWNCAHIANGEVIRRLLQINQRLNRPTPIILTPEELLETSGGEKK